MRYNIPMKIIFDKEKAGRWGVPNDPHNTADKLIKRREKTLETLGRFVGADCIEYIDDDKVETYLITKAKKILRLDVCGNHFDGGWLNVSIEKEQHENT